jgi:glucan endo-1,3-beta-D-glucosidase
VFSIVRPSSTVPSPVLPSSSHRPTDFPIPSSIPADLRGAFEAPHHIVTIDKANRGNVVGNGFSAKLSPTTSTVFAFDVHQEHKGKLCNLVFYMPPTSPFDDLVPVKLRTFGGISLSRLDNGVATSESNASNVAAVTLLGTVPLVQPANQYSISSTPCEAGTRVWYQIDSVGGLSMDFFQTTLPPSGLFMIPG